MTSAPRAFLLYNGKPVAEPCFRSMHWFSGSLNDAAGQKIAADLAGWFWRNRAAQGSFVTLASSGRQPKARPAAPDVLSGIGEWIKDARKPYGSWLQIEGPDEAGGASDRTPWLYIRQGRAMIQAEICLPHDQPDLRAAADAIADLAMRDDLLCGLQGMGYLLPPRKEELVAIMPATTLRYPAAIELQLLHPVNGLQRDGSMFFWEDHPDLQPGLPDIGWRTILGPELARRAGDLAELPGVTVARQGALVSLTAGPAPIWGDVNAGEDISAFRAVAAALAPLAIPRQIMESDYFAGDPDDPDHMDRLERYLSRFDT